MYRIISSATRTEVEEELRLLDRDFVIASTEFSVASTTYGNVYAVLVRYHERKRRPSVGELTSA